MEKNRPPKEHPYIDVLDLIIQDHMKKNEDIFFVQIGANDGQTDDPISHFVRKYGWRGLLIEPQATAFKRLMENYRGEDQLIFENTLVTKYDGTATFYSVPEDMPGLPYNLYQTGSLSHEVLVSIIDASRNKTSDGHIPHNTESLVKESTLPATKPETLLKKHNIRKVDLLVIDTMGHDFEILKIFPFHVVKPSIIHFEHNLLSTDDQETCFKYLAELGYSFIHVWQDTIAYLHGPVRRSLYSPH